LPSSPGIIFPLLDCVLVGADHGFFSPATAVDFAPFGLLYGPFFPASCEKFQPGRFFLQRLGKAPSHFLVRNDPLEILPLPKLQSPCSPIPTRALLVLLCCPSSPDWPFKNISLKASRRRCLVLCLVPQIQDRTFHIRLWTFFRLVSRSSFPLGMVAAVRSSQDIRDLFLLCASPFKVDFCTLNAGFCGTSFVFINLGFRWKYLGRRVPGLLGWFAFQLYSVPKPFTLPIFAFRSFLVLPEFRNRGLRTLLPSFCPFFFAGAAVFSSLLLLFSRCCAITPPPHTPSQCQSPPQSPFGTPLCRTKPPELRPPD